MDTEKQIHEIAVLCGKSGGIADAKADLIYIRAKIILFYDEMERKRKRVQDWRRVALYNRIVFGIVVLVLDILYMVTAEGARMVLGFVALFLAFALIALGLIGLDWTWRKKNGR